MRARLPRILQGALRQVAQALLLSLGLFACKKPPPPPPPPPPAVARVDGAPILLSTVQREVDRLRIGEAGRLDTSATTLELAHAVLGPLIDRQILAAQARALGLSVSEADIQRATDALADDAQSAGLNFTEHLAQDGETAAQLHDEVREQLLAEQAISRALPLEKPTPAELKAYAEQHKSELQQPEEVRAAQILVATPEEAKSLLDQLRAGAAFDALARAHSLSPEARQGGDLGFFPRGVMPPQFDEVCFQLKPNQLSGIVRTPYGFHIFKLLAKRPARRRSLEEAAPELAIRWVRETRAAAGEQLLATLRAKAQITVDEGQLAAVK